MADQYINDSIDWQESESEYVMWDVLTLKAEQSQEFTSELMNTGNCELQHTVPDRYWGTGSTSVKKSFDGLNRYGAHLEHLRSQLRSQKQANLKPRNLNRTMATHTNQPKCDFCGLTGHLKSQCYHGQPIKCYRCNYYGHKYKSCLSSQ